MLEEAKNDNSFMNRMKMKLFSFVKKNAFITVLLAASVGSFNFTILDPQPFVRPGWPDLWPPLDSFPSVFCCYLHRQSCKQGINLNCFHNYGLQ